MRLVTLCAIASLALTATSSLAQGLPWSTGTLERGGEVRAGVQHRTEEGIRCERLRFADAEAARAWAFEALGEAGADPPGRLLVEVRGKRAVRLSGEGLAGGEQARKALRQTWGEEAAEEAPDLLAVRADRKVALLGKSLPADPGSKLPAGLKLDPEAARPLETALGDRKVTLPAPAPAESPGMTGSLTPE